MFKVSIQTVTNLTGNPVPASPVVSPPAYTPRRCSLSTRRRSSSPSTLLSPIAHIVIPDLPPEHPSAVPTIVPGPSIQSEHQATSSRRASLALSVERLAADHQVVWKLAFSKLIPPVFQKGLRLNAQSFPANCFCWSNRLCTKLFQVNKIVKYNPMHWY